MYTPSRGLAPGTGTAATALGGTTVATASNTDTTAVGNGATASNTNTTAVGSGSVASANYATATGKGATASGSTSIALGGNSSATGNSTAAIGYGAVANATGATAIGNSATCSTTGANSTAIGRDASCTGASSVGIGQAVANPAGSAVAIGNSATIATTATGSVAIGNAATVVDTSGLSDSVVIGRTATGESRNTVIGAKAQGTTVSATAIGRGAISSASHAIAIGRGAWANTANMIAIGFSGGNSATDVFFESGHTHKYIDPVDNVTITRIPASTPIIIHGFDAYDATGTPTNDVAGGDLKLAAGRGTGTGAGGSLIIQTAPAGGASNNTKNALVDAAKFDTNGAQNETRMLLWDVTAAALVRVSRGAPDSGGTGYRLLRIPN